MDERTEMLRAAFAKCKPVNVPNMRAALPADFFTDFDSGEELDDKTVFAEIQAAMRATPADPPHQVLLIETDPAGNPLRPVDAELIAPAEPFPTYLPPSEHVDQQAAEVVTLADPIESVAEIAAPPASQPVDHAAGGPGPLPQERLDRARKREDDLLSVRGQLHNAVREARAVLSEAVIAYQQIDPARQTAAQLSAEFRRASQEQRAARKRGEAWACPPERKVRGQNAFVDLERNYSGGGGADAFARKMNRTGNRRGAYSSHSLGMANNDPSRGPTPKPVVPQRPTIPRSRNESKP